MVRRWAHPRSRGENTDTEVEGIPASGSSPLTRGKPDLVKQQWSGAGLIPAHAGKTTCTHTGSASTAAHPRSRGENRWVTGCLGYKWGSSPLTRGKRAGSSRTRRRRRLIPAHAGKTKQQKETSPPAPAHPRSRGENLQALDADERRWGSSPLTRGKPRGTSPTYPPHRLIPAHAGKTMSLVYQSWVSRAHPRSRGENLDVADGALIAAGSSPLTRGKPNDGEVRAFGTGLIPAHAGKTVGIATESLVPTAHPRSRGENIPRWCARRPASGSSPLTRGKPHPSARADD